MILVPDDHHRNCIDTGPPPTHLRHPLPPPKRRRLPDINITERG